EEVSVFAECGAADFGHVVGEEEVGEAAGFFVPEEEGALVAVGGAADVGVLLVHLAVDIGHGALGLAAEKGEVVIGDGALEDEVAFIVVLAAVGFGDLQWVNRLHGGGIITGSGNG